MKTFAQVLGITLALLALVWLFSPTPDIEQTLRSSTSPLQVELHEDGTSTALGVHIGHDKLADVEARFGTLEQIALFRRERQPVSLEAWFGTVRIGLLEGKLVARLAADPKTLQALQQQVSKRESTDSGSEKWLLDRAAGTQAMQMTVDGLTFIPRYSGLEAEFFLERLGPAAEQRQISDSASQYFFPAQGLDLVVDDAGKEVLQYRTPRDYVIPPPQPEHRAGKDSAKDRPAATQLSGTQ